MVVENVYQLQDLARGVQLQLDGRSGNARDLGVAQGDTGRVQGVAHGGEVLRVGRDLEAVTLDAEILGAGLEHDLKDAVLVVTLGRNADHALLREVPRYASTLTQVSVVLAQDVADLADRSVLAVRQRVDHQRHALRTVGLVDRLLVDHALDQPRALRDGLIDLVVGHVRGLSGLHLGAESHVRIDVSPTRTRRDLDEPRVTVEDLAALGVKGALLVLDAGPLGVS